MKNFRSLLMLGSLLVGGNSFAASGDDANGVCPPACPGLSQYCIVSVGSDGSHTQQLGVGTTPQFMADLVARKGYTGNAYRTGVCMGGDDCKCVPTSHDTSWFRDHTNQSGK